MLSAFIENYLKLLKIDKMSINTSKRVKIF